MGNETLVGILIVETLPGLLIALVTFALTWGVGQRLATYWAIQQKRKELELAAANNFYRQYGEFFAIWKLWNYAREEKQQTDRRAELLNRAATMEAGLEAGFVRVTSERKLTTNECRDLGALRQRFQFLRESIRDDKKIPWHGSNNSEYLDFKRLATRFGNLLASDSSSSVPTAQEAADAFKSITDNGHESDFKNVARGADGVVSSEKLPAAPLEVSPAPEKSRESAWRT